MQSGSLSVDEPTGTVILVLVSAVGLLLALAVAFAIYAVILRTRNERKGRRLERLEERWTELVLEAMDRPDAVDEVLDRVSRKDGPAFVDFLVSFARRIRGREEKVLRGLARPFLSRVAEQLQSDDAGRRAQAVQTLGTLGLPAYAEELRVALDDPAPLVALVAARRLCIPDRATHVSAVLDRLHRFRTWNDRFLARMLAAVGTGAAGALRAKLADRDAGPWVRTIAARALSALGDLEAADPAVQIVERDPDPELTAAALELLGRVGREEHVALVRKRAGHPHPRVRSEALGALGRLAGEEGRRILIGGLADESPWVAKYAARGLLAAGSEKLLRDVAESEHARAALADQVLHEEGRR